MTSVATGAVQLTTVSGPVASTSRFPDPVAPGSGMVGVAGGSTVRATDVVAALKFTESAGVNVTDNNCAGPAYSTVPACGEYTNVPGTEAVALSCVALNAVP